MSRLTYCMYLLTPVLIYYYLLSAYPVVMGNIRIWDCPLSLVFGVIVMFWGVLIALLFAIDIVGQYKDQ